MLANKVMIQDRLGGTISSVDTSTFWSALGTTPLSPTTTYQRVFFDPLHGRWVATGREGTIAARSTRILFAISQTDDPTGAWNFYSITADPGATQAADWVVTGYNSTWIAICANMFNVPTGATLLGTKMWVIDAASALIPGGPITVNVFATGWTTAVHGSELTLQRDECLLVLVRGPADPSRGHVRASEAGGPSTIATSDGDRPRLELRR